MFELNAALGGQQHGPTYGLRQLHTDEEFPRVQISLTRFVDHTELPVLLGHGVSDGDVEFATFQRHVVTIILHADDQHYRGFRHKYLQL